MKTFQKATKRQSFLRLALVGPSGSGKTYTSLRVAHGFGTKIALLDSERGSASKYAGDFAFDTLALDTFSPREYIEGIEAAVAGGYEVLVIDSLSHAWMGKGGILEMHEMATAQDRAGNSYTSWRFVTPEHNKLVDAILQAPLHIIATVLRRSMCRRKMTTARPSFVRSASSRRNAKISTSSLMWWATWTRPIRW